MTDSAGDELFGDPASARAALFEMIRIRRFEERAAELYTLGKIRGFLHLYIGEEAVAVGVIPCLDEGDAFVGTYREHGHALVRGVSAASIMAEMYGVQEGCSGGRGGSMHLFDAERRFYGGHAIVGGGLPIAVGLALADRMRGENVVTACFFGEGAVAEGEFHESMNLAALWRLPVLFVCENNGYAMGTALQRSESELDIHRKAASYNIAAEAVDGMDVALVREAARRAVGSIRQTGCPYFLECRTYRFRAHSMFDPELYRDRDEVARWKERDPIDTFFARARDAGLVSQSERQEIEKEVAAEVDGAVKAAEGGTREPIEQIHRHVYAGGSEPGQ